MSGLHKSPDETQLPQKSSVDTDHCIQPVLRIERTLLLIRYIALFVYMLLFGFELVPPIPLILVVVASSTLIVNAFAHIVISTGAYTYFVHPINLIIHLAYISILVCVSGAEFSPLIVLYPMFIIGYGLYAPQFKRVYAIAMLCCDVHVFTVVVYRKLFNVEVYYPAILLECMGIFMCGWLMETLSRLLLQLENVAQDRARALSASEVMLRTILNNADSPIVVYNDDEFITAVNDRACEFLSASRADMLGRRFRSYIFDDGTLPNKLASLRSRGQYHGEVLVLTNEGEERTVEMRAQSFMQDEKRYFVSIMHDVTEQKNFQEASRLATQKMEQANRELQQLNRIRTAFFNAISQRLRSPLSAVLGFIELLQGEELGEINEQQNKALQGARRSVTRALDLVEETVTVVTTEANNNDSAFDTTVFSPADSTRLPELVDDSSEE